MGATAAGWGAQNWGACRQARILGPMKRKEASYDKILAGADEGAELNIRQTEGKGQEGLPHLIKTNEDFLPATTSQSDTCTRNVCTAKRTLDASLSSQVDVLMKSSHNLEEELRKRTAMVRAL